VNCKLQNAKLGIRNGEEKSTIAEGSFHSTIRKVLGNPSPGFAKGYALAGLNPLSPQGRGIERD